MILALGNAGQMEGRIQGRTFSNTKHVQICVIRNMRSFILILKEEFKP